MDPSITPEYSDFSNKSDYPFIPGPITGLGITTEHPTMSEKKIELCPTKAASQQTQLCGVKLKFLKF